MSFFSGRNNGNGSVREMDGANLLAHSAGMQAINTKMALQSESNMEITGDDQQILTVSLGHEEEMLVQPGCMVWCDSGIKSQVSAGGCSNFCTRMCCLGQSGFRVHWLNETEEVQRIGLTPSFPAKVIPINLSTHSGELFIKSGSFIAATDPDLEFKIERAGRSSGGTMGKGFFGGQGFVLTKLKGQGWVFLSGAGAIFEKTLDDNETIVVDTHSVLAWETTVQFNYRMSGNVGMMCCGGEGFANTTLTGPGYVAIQSMPFEKVRAMMANPNGDAADQNPAGQILGCIISLFFVFIWVAVSIMTKSQENETDSVGYS